MTQSIHILLVEDSPTQAREYSLQLEREGYSVQIAEDGAAALSEAERHPPHVIVLDINLPGMNGFQVCRRLKRSPTTERIPVIMLTAADNANDTLTGLEAGADDYIPKDRFAVQNLLITLGGLQLSPTEEGNPS